MEQATAEKLQSIMWVQITAAVLDGIIAKMSLPSFNVFWFSAVSCLVAHFDNTCIHVGAKFGQFHPCIGTFQLLNFKIGHFILIFRNILGKNIWPDHRVRPVLLGWLNYVLSLAMILSSTVKFIWTHMMDCNFSAVACSICGRMSAEVKSYTQHHCHAI